MCQPIEAVAIEPAIDEIEAKRLRKAARRAAKECPAAAEEVAAEPEIDEVEAKKKRKAAKRTATEAAAATEEAAAEIDEVEAKKQRKAAKKAEKEAATAEVAAATATTAEEDDAALPQVLSARDEKRRLFQESLRKKRAAEAAAVTELDEAPKAKKSKQMPETVDAVAAAGKEVNYDTSADVAEVKETFEVFIKGLPYSADAITLRKEFKKCGYILDFKMPVNEDGQAKGFAFIKFSTQEGLDAALKLDNSDFGGRYMNICKADAKGKGKGKAADWTCPNCSEMCFASRSHCRKCETAKPGGEGGDKEKQVFIRGLPFTVTEEAFRKDFAKCGEIEKLSFPKHEDGTPKGISFITYKTQAGVDAALKFDGTEYSGRNIFVSMAGAPPAKGKGKSKDSKGKGKSKESKGKGKDKGDKCKGKAEEKPAWQGEGGQDRASFAKNSGCIVAPAGEAKTFADSDDE